MAVDVGDVKQWAIERGVHHVVLSVSGGYVATACGMWGNTTRLVDVDGVPRLVCRRCRRELEDLRETDQQCEARRACIAN